MKAVTFDEFGGPDVLHAVDLPSPVPGPDEVLIRVAASTVNPADIMMRDGRQATMMRDLAPPYIAGMEFSGTIVAEGAPAFELGQPVFGVVNPRTPRGGAYAQLIAVSAASVVPLSHNIDLVAAATVPMNALTAFLALDLLALGPASSVLVTGGAGMLGGYVIQLAKDRGLKVLANVSAADRALVSGFGADVLLPRDAGLEDALRAVCPAGVDGLVDGALIGQQVRHLVRDGGAAISLRKSHPIEDDRLRVAYVSVVAGMEDTGKLRRIAQLTEEGRLTPRVAPDGRYGFRDARKAHERAEAGGLRGRIVITFD